MLIELSILAAFGAMLFWGIGDFLIQRTVRKIGEVEALALIGLIGGLAITPFIINDFKLLLSMQNLAVLLFFSIILFIVSVINFKALDKGKLSIVEVILQIELPVTIFLAFIFFKETISLIQFIAILFIFLGILLIALKAEHIKNPIKSLEKGVGLAIITAIGLGFINFLTAASSKSISPLMTIWFSWLMISFFSLFYIAKKGNLRIFLSQSQKFKTLVLAMTAFDTLAWIFYAFSSVKTNLAITTSISESYPAVALFLGLWLNKEKINWHQYLGAFIALVASFLLGFIS